MNLLLIKSKAAAYHEAGHVILHHLFKKRYKNVAVNRFLGEIKSAYLHSKFSANRKSSLQDKLIYASICFAGSTAQYIFQGFSHDELCRLIEREYALGEGYGKTDWEKYRSLELPDFCSSLIAEFTIKAITENWELVGKIADSILEHQELTFEQVYHLSKGNNFTAKRQTYLKELRIIQGEMATEKKAIAARTAS